MNLLAISVEQGWQIAGWTMCYFLVLGTAVALVGGATRVLCRRAAPQVRYAVSLSILALLAVLPVGIALWLIATPAPVAAVARTIVFATPGPWPQDTGAASPNRANMPILKPPYAPEEGPANPSQLQKNLPDNDATTVRPKMPVLRPPHAAGERTAAAPPIEAKRPNNLSTPAAPSMPILRPPHAPAEGAAPARRIGNAPAATLLVAAPKKNAWDQALHWLPWAWLIGASLTFALLATGLVGSQRLRAQSQRLTTGPAADACRRLCASLAMGRRVTVAVCERVAAPLIVGIVRPLILLPPAALTGWTPQQLEMVLLHELAHVRRWDNLVNLLQRIIEAVLFYHPAIWLISRQVRRDREECCDSVVVNHTAAPQAYAELLISLAAPAQPLAGVALARHPLTQRVRRILKLEEETMLVSRSTIGMVAIAILAVFAAPLWQPQTGAIAEDAAAEVDSRAEVAALTDEQAEGTPDQDHEFTFPANTPESQIQEQIERLKSRGMAVSIRKNDDGSLVVSGAEKHAGIVLPAHPVFLSLEDQRAADLAYKLLGLELEPLDEKGLARVKEMKFAGGLQIAGLGGMSKHGSPALGARDLLVGLHVWPVTALEDVVKILQRDDIGELSPLKFYAIRDESRGGFGGGGHRKLFTGRIGIRSAAKETKGSTVPASAENEGFSNSNEMAGSELHPYVLRPGDTVVIRVTGTLSEYPVDDKFQIESMGTVALGPTYGRVKVAGLTLLKAEVAVREHLQTILANVEVQITVLKNAGQGQDLAAGAQEKVTEFRASGSTLLYDGKTFDEWRSLWKNELMTQKRIEAIKALAAFGRSSHGREAAEAILDVAGEYDFEKRLSAETTLFDAIAASLYASVPVKIWLPMLHERYLANPEAWEAIAMEVLPKVNDAGIRSSQIEVLITIALSEQSGRKDTALRALVSLDPGLQDRRITETIQSRLDSSQESEQIRGLFALRHAGRIMPEVVQLSFQGSERIKKLTRQVIHVQGNSAASQALFVEMVDALQSPAHKEHTLDVIRNIAAIGDVAKPARDDLKKFLQHEDPRLQVAAAVAIGRITGGPTGSAGYSLLKKVLFDEGEPPSDEEIQERISAENKAIL